MYLHYILNHKIHQDFHSICLQELIYDEPMLILGMLNVLLKKLHMWTDYRVWFFNTQERYTVGTSIKKSISNNLLDLGLILENKLILVKI